MSSYKDEDPIDGFIDVNRTTFAGGNSNNNAGNETMGYQCYDNGTLVVPVQVCFDFTNLFTDHTVEKLDRFSIDILYLRNGLALIVSGLKI
jgi:hypothetical protein